jgi:hypothetical protein
VIDLAAATDGEDEDQQRPVIDLVDDAVVTGAYAPLAVPADECEEPDKPTRYQSPEPG